MQGCSARGVWSSAYSVVCRRCARESYICKGSDFFEGVQQRLPSHKVCKIRSVNSNIQGPKIQNSQNFRSRLLGDFVFQVYSQYGNRMSSPTIYKIMKTVGQRSCGGERGNWKFHTKPPATQAGRYASAVSTALQVRINKGYAHSVLLLLESPAEEAGHQIRSLFSS